MTLWIWFSLIMYVIGIVGLGMIGNSTAVLCTMHGYKTICYVRSEEKIPQYRAAFDRMYDEMIAQGIMTKAEAEICGTYLKYVTSYADMAECTFIFEAITEDLKLKEACYSEIEKNWLAPSNAFSSAMPYRLQINRYLSESL